MPTYAFDFQPATTTERDAATKWFRSQARAAQRLIKLANDPTARPISAQFTVVMERLLDRYRESLKRLAKQSFTTRRSTQ